MDNGFKPSDTIVDEPVTFPGEEGGAPYEPQNYDQKFRGTITLRYALQESVNIPAIKLLRKVGTSLVASYARRMGIKSPLGQNLSLAFGSSEVNLLALTSAYGVLGNRGVRNYPMFMLKARAKNGFLLERQPPCLQRAGQGGDHTGPEHRQRDVRGGFRADRVLHHAPRQSARPPRAHVEPAGLARGRAARVRPDAGQGRDPHLNRRVLGAPWPRS